MLWPAIPRPEDSQVLGLLFQMEQSQWWSPDEILHRQLAQASLLIRHAIATCPFYQRHLAAQSGLSSEPLTWERFREIPVLKRSDVQEHSQDLVSLAIPPGHQPVVKVSTSGSTGRPIQVLSTPVTQLLFRTLGLRFHVWHGRDSTQTNMSIRLVRGQRPRISQSNGWMPCYPPGPAFSYCSTLSIDELYQGLLQVEPVYLQVYPSIVSELIRRTREQGIRLRRLAEVRTFGGVLDPAIREQCREHWGVPIADNYSALEMGIIALQCPETTNLHVQSENVLMEVVRPDGSPCQTGESGRILVTVLSNFATPLIRYELGDWGEIAPQCPCGRKMLTLSRIVGRDMHLFTFPDGQRAAPFVHPDQFEKLAPVRQFQIVQTTRLEIDVNLVNTQPVTEAEEQLLREHFQKHLHPDFHYRFHYLSEIPRGATGKFETFRCDLR